MFVHGSREPFMGVWNPHTNTGTVHFAEYEELPAKKIWSWGVDADGLDWRKALSDNNSAYLEVQARPVSQPGNLCIPRAAANDTVLANTGCRCARSAESLVRIWRESRDSVRRESEVYRRINVNQAYPWRSDFHFRRQSASISGKDRPRARAYMDARGPERGQPGKYTIEIKDAKGIVLLRQTEGVYDWTPSRGYHRWAAAGISHPRARQAQLR